jgi:hypothetical protein
VLRCLNRKKGALYSMWKETAARNKGDFHTVQNYLLIVQEAGLRRALDFLQREVYCAGILRRCCATFLQAGLSSVFRKWRDGGREEAEQHALIRRVAMMIMGQGAVMAFAQWREAWPLPCLLYYSRNPIIPTHQCMLSAASLPPPRLRSPNSTSPGAHCPTLAGR